MKQKIIFHKICRHVSLCVLLLLMIIQASAVSAADESLKELVSSMAKAGIDISSKQLGAVKAYVVENPERSSKMAVRKLNKKSTSESERAIWVWVLGLGGNPEAVKHIIAQVTPEASAILRANVDNALGQIGGPEAGKFLFSQMINAKGDEYKNHLLLLMARAGYEDAIRKSEGLLKQDMNESRYVAVFFYGTMGRASVPFLISRLDHWNVEVRKNAAKVLGQWLLAKEAAGPLISRYKKEEDPIVRRILLDALERTMEDLTALEQFMKKVEKEETKPIVRRFARESLANVSRMRGAVAKKYEERKPDELAFKTVFDELYKNKGVRGDYSMLGRSSDINMEQNLEKLRGQILSRGVPESIYDAQKVNRIILINRLIQAEGLK